MATLDREVGPKYWVIVSNNGRNRNFDTALAVRVTTTNRHANLDSVVALPAGEVLNGWVACDSLTEIWDDDLARSTAEGALSRRAMSAVEDGLMAALGSRR
jgi:mRNA interferase MazF